MAKKLKITQVRSIIGSQRKKHRSVMQALGFRKNYQTIYRSDTPIIRGMIRKVRHLVVWEEIDEKDVPAAQEKSKGYMVVGSAGASAGAPAKGSTKDSAKGKEGSEENSEGALSDEA